MTEEELREAFPEEFEEQSDEQSLSGEPTISRLGNNDCDYVFNQGVYSLMYPKNGPVYTDWLLLFVYSYDNNPQYQIQFATNIHSSDIYIRNIEQYAPKHPNYHPHYPWFKVATDTTYVSPAAEEHVD